MRRVTAGALAGLLALGAYGVLDAADTVPGYLTTRPLPPPPPTETVAPRVLPEVAQPTSGAGVSTAGAGVLPSLAGATLAPSAGGVEAAVEQALGAAALRDAAVVVRDAQSGQVLLDRDGSTARIPASTTKVLSAAAVATVFGPTDTLQTSVVAGGAPGQVVLVAGGDTLLAPGAGDPSAVAGRAGLADLADQVVAALRAAGPLPGLVTVLVDGAYASGPLASPTWGADYQPSGITGSVAMLGRSDQRAVPGRPGPSDPVAATAQIFVQLLAERGVAAELGGTGSAASGAAVLGSVRSAPVQEQLALALTDSDNALIESLARQAAFRSLETGAALGFPEVGAWVVRTAATLGIPTAGMRLDDASGLSRENRATAASLAAVLVMVHDGAHPTLAQAVAGLPVAGLTGTLAERYVGEGTGAAAGVVRAKTGTLTGANALAGTVVDRDGRLLAFALMVADAPTLDARAAMDRVVAALAGCGCR